MKSTILSSNRSDLERTPSQLRDIGDDAVDAAKTVGAQLADLARDKADTVSHIVANDVDKIKSYVKDQPGKGLAMAFAAGAVIALLLRRS